MNSTSRPFNGKIQKKLSGESDFYLKAPAKASFSQSCALLNSTTLPFRATWNSTRFLALIRSLIPCGSSNKVSGELGCPKINRSE